VKATRTIEASNGVFNEFFSGPDPSGLIASNGAASVAVSAGYSLGYGAAKCSVTVSLTCDQDAASIARAYDAAFEAANHMAVDGMRRLDQSGESFVVTPGRPR